MVVESAKASGAVVLYAGGTLLGFSIDNVTGIVAAVVGGFFIGLAFALPKALPALKSAGTAWLEYKAKRDTIGLAAWEANEAAHLHARLVEDEKMRPTLTAQLEVLREQAARLEVMLEEARYEAKEAKAEAREAKEQAAINAELTKVGTERAVRHSDANLANIRMLQEAISKMEGVPGTGDAIKATVDETAESVHKIQDAIDLGSQSSRNGK